MRRPYQPSRCQALGATLLAALGGLLEMEAYFNWGLLDLLLWLSRGEWLIDNELTDKHK